VRTLHRREKVLLLLVAAGALGYVLLRPNGAAPARAARSEPLPPPLPRIALSRVAAERPPNDAGRRDLFRFGSARADGPEAEEEPPEVMVPVAPTPGPVVENVPAQPTPPPMNLKFLGSVENKAGIKVAVLLTDRKEVLTGQAGETVANRYRIARIGIESVDVEDVASGQSRRIPLKGQ
jgi:hypothetical protein